MRTAIASSLCLLFAIGCTREIAPPAVPQHVVPDVDMPKDAPIAGSDRYVIDSVGEPAKVIEITGEHRATVYAAGRIGYGFSEDTKPVCVTPCVVDLPRGMHAFRFSSERDIQRHSTVDVSSDGVGKTVVVRHAMGSDRYHGGLTALGVLAATLGVVGVGLGIPFAAVGDVSNNQPMRDASIAGAVAGGSLLVIGILSLIVGAEEVQHGSTTKWTLQRPQ